VEIHDTWYTTGLAGSGSNDYSVSEVFVPDEHVFCPLEVGHRDGPLYRYHGWFFTKLVGVAIGTGRRAIDELINLADNKIAPPAMHPIKHEYRIQVEVARAEADLAACRALTDATLEEVWDSLVAGDPPTTAQRAAIGALGIWVTQTVKTMVDRICAEVGTASIYAGAPLERIRRDLTTMSHHLAGQTRTYQTVGQLRLGLPTQFPIF
jgi:alkylation response protein AidB-like acyl-CoA dehydrogenase